jgi:minor curlin subunit
MLFLGIVYAQDNVRERTKLSQLQFDQIRFEEQLLDQLSNSPSSGNNAVISQRFSRNNASVYQQLLNPYKGSNNALIIQAGVNNDAAIVEVGSNLNAGIGQFGNSNSHSLDLFGENMNMFTLQTGNNNTLDLSVAGRNMDYVFSQYGSNNAILQADKNTELLQQMKITQRGDGITLYIDQAPRFFK